MPPVIIKLHIMADRLLLGFLFLMARDTKPADLSDKRCLVLCYASYLKLLGRNQSVKRGVKDRADGR